MPLSPKESGHNPGLKSLLLAGAFALSGCAEKARPTTEYPSITPEQPTSTHATVQRSKREFDFRPVSRNTVVSKLDSGECNFVNKVDLSEEDTVMTVVLECRDGTGYLVRKICPAPWQIDSEQHPYCDGRETKEHYQILRAR